MYNEGIKGCSFVVCNTDSQALRCSPVPIRSRWDAASSGHQPVNGRNAALESQDR